MIICFDKKTKKLKSIINGENPISPFDNNISSIDLPDQYFMAKKGDLVCTDENTKTISIGSNLLKMYDNDYTIITLENYLNPIILEEL